MFDSVRYIRELCKQRHIPISTLEAECGFANGYLNPKKLKKLPYDRAVKIGAYLGVSPDYLLTGQETKNAPPQREAHELGFDDFTYAMHNETKDLPQEKKDMLLEMARFLKREFDKENT